MVDLFRAEWRKTAGNRWTTGFLVWIFPIGALGLIVLVFLVALFAPSARAEMMQEKTIWTNETISVWGFPNNILGRMLLLGFTAVVFAGEYSWGTLKNVVPRSKRTSLILVKFLLVSTMVLLAFLLMSIVWGGGQTALAMLFGGQVGPQLTGEVVRGFIGDYIIQAGLALISVIIGAGYVALAAMLMRSILGGLLVGLGITLAEPVSLLGLFGISRLFDAPRLVHLFRLTPIYNLDNAQSWLVNQVPSEFGEAFRQAGPDYVFADGLETSLFIMLVWVSGLIILSTFFFNRQDISS